MAADCLGLMADTQPVNALVDLLRDSVPAVRAAASRALERLGWQPAKASDRVLQILASGKTSAAASLGAEAVEPLAELMRSGPEPKQLEAVRALGRIEDPRIKALMMEALGRDNPTICIEALGTLVRLGDETCLDAMQKMLSNRHPGVRSAAVEAVAICGQRKAAPTLLRMLKDGSWEVRSSAVRALGALGDVAVVEEIAVLLADPDRDVRESAINALGGIRDRRALPVLVLAMIDRESSLRSAAAAALRRIDRNWENNPAVREALPKIKAALNHSEYWVRHSANQLFAKLKVNPAKVGDAAEHFSADEPPSHPAFTALSDMLGDPDRDLRLAAVEAFRELDLRKAANLVGSLVNDRDRNVQLAARQALVELK
jgi:HEAT repeat protein